MMRWDEMMRAENITNGMNDDAFVFQRRKTEYTKQEIDKLQGEAWPVLEAAIHLTSLILTSPSALMEGS